jgi:hypothetical protein
MPQRPNIPMPRKSPLIIILSAVQNHGSLEDLVKVGRRYRLVKTESRRFEAPDIELGDIRTRQVRLGAPKPCRSEQAWSTGDRGAFQVTPPAARQKSRTREAP